MIKLAFTALTLTVLAGIIVLEQLHPPGEPEPEAANPVPLYGARPGTSSAVVTGPANSATSGTLATILARPLFEPTRRPLAPPTATGAPGERLPRLSGILVTSAGRLVIFAATQGGKSMTAKEGTKIGSFLVEAISPRSVTVRGPDGVQTIEPNYDPDEGAPATVAFPSLVVRTQTPAVQSSFRQGPTLQTIVRPPGRAPGRLPMHSDPADGANELHTGSESPS
jgi:hypothetical protein